MTDTGDAFDVESESYNPARNAMEFAFSGTFRSIRMLPLLLLGLAAGAGTLSVVIAVLLARPLLVGGVIWLVFRVLAENDVISRSLAFGPCLVLGFCLSLLLWIGTE